MVEAHRERQELRAALASFLRGQDRKAQRVVKLMGEGIGDDMIAEKVGCTLEDVERVRAALAAHLQAAGLDHESDEEISTREAIEIFGEVISKKQLETAVKSERVEARKVQGEWRIRLASVRSFARMMESRGDSSAMHDGCEQSVIF